MMNYSKQHFDSVSTVQLSPFSEDQWNRIVTYSPIYLHWTDLLLMSQKRVQKSLLGKRHLIGSIDIKASKLEDEILLNEIHNIKKTAVITNNKILKENNSDDGSKSLDEEYNRRPTSPTDEYQRSTDFFYQTREPPKPYSSHVEPSFSHNTKRSLLQTQMNNTGPLKALPNINLGPKPQASLSVQLRQSAKARENALGTINDHRSTSPLSMSSSKRAVGGGNTSAHSNHRRRIHQQYRTINSQTPSLIDVNVITGLYEQSSVDSSSSIKKSYLRSTNTSRSTLHKIKTKNERTKQKQQIELKTILVQPCRQPVSTDGDLEEIIPNSIETMKKFNGTLSTFEKNLKFNYHRQLNQYRNSSTKY